MRDQFTHGSRAFTLEGHITTELITETAKPALDAGPVRRGYNPLAVDCEGTMANEEHLAILKNGAGAWDEWRKQNPDVEPDLRRANLKKANLNRANLNGVYLVSANLEEATLNGAYLKGANLERASLKRANLGTASLDEARLNFADLSGADLSGATLSGATFEGASLAGATLSHVHCPLTDFSRADLQKADFTGAGLAANLTGAKLYEADFTSVDLFRSVLGDLDLGDVKGLETVIHSGPSTIGIDTIYRSKGKIPDVFLRGAGVPEEFITYMKSLVANPIEFYSCFISYSTKDQEFAERLHGDLQNKNVRCWFAPHDVQGGKKLYEQIDQAIRVHEKVLLILSAQSMSSEWVKTEIAKARKREVREKKQVLFPVRLVPFEAIRDWECFDADAGKDSAREIREYFIPDFSEWKEHDKYKKAFERLLGDLKAGERRVES
jgi:uncharacterized protein YjbI with pentapeptide repeats